MYTTRASDLNLAAAIFLLHRSEFMRPPPILLHLLSYARLLPPWKPAISPPFLERVKLTDPSQEDHMVLRTTCFSTAIKYACDVCVYDNQVKWCTSGCNIHTHTHTQSRLITSIIPLNPTVFGRPFLEVESKMALRVPCQVGLAEINNVLLG
jgi:hypothetical protein